MDNLKNQALVSLVTPGWNGKRFVHRLFDSIIAQTYRPIEYIYVDDGSTDGTAEVVKSYAPKFKDAGIDFRYIWQENGGVSEAVMSGLQYVRGEFFSAPEYDDILMPESVAMRVNYLRTHLDCAVVVADAWIVDEENLGARNCTLAGDNPNRYERNHFFQCLRSRTVFNAACMLIRTKEFDITHPGRRFYPSRIGPNQQILLPLYYHWNRGFIETPLSLFLVRKDSISHSRVSIDVEIEKIKDYRALRIATLETIEMPIDDLDIYKHQVELLYHKSLLHLYFLSYNKYMFFQVFAELEKLEGIDDNSRCEYHLITHPLRYKINKLKQSLLAKFKK